MPIRRVYLYPGRMRDVLPAERGEWEEEAQHPGRKKGPGGGAAGAHGVPRERLLAMLSPEEKDIMRGLERRQS